MKRRTVGCRFPVELYDALVAAAELRGVSVNWLVVKAVEWYLPRLLPADVDWLTGTPAPWAPPRAEDVRAGPPLTPRPGVVTLDLLER